MDLLLKRVFTALLALTALLTISFASGQIPVHTYRQSFVPGYAAAQKGDIARRTTVAPGTELRVLPLGDSITFGYLSSDGNGYRIGLQEDLSGSNLDFIGSVQAGTMADNSNEGHPGKTIKEIAGFATLSLPDRPNVILLHAGTNDLNNDPPADPWNSAIDRLGALVDQIITACPDAAVLVAQIINAASPGTESRIQAYNGQIPAMVAQRADNGHRVMVVDMTSVTVDDLQDGLHPSDEGYRKMADLWFNAIREAAAKGWIEPPVTPDPSVSSATVPRSLRPSVMRRAPRLPTGGYNKNEWHPDSA